MGEQRHSALRRFLDVIVENDSSASDSNLLERFIREQDQAAFAMLVKRHGFLVQRVCTRMGLGEHAADDVFQATFLVFAQKAGTLRGGQAIGPFVHGTAHRVALNILRLDRRRLLHERAVSKQENQADAEDVAARVSVREAQGIVESELAALPDKYRIPLILHYLEEKSHEEAARKLHLERSTVSRRIKRGRDLLRQRLGKHGIELSAMMLALLLGKAQAAIPFTLAAATAKSAVLYVQGSDPASTATLLASSAIAGLSKVTGPARVAATIKLWLGKTAAVVLVGGACAGVWYETRSTAPWPESGFTVSPTTSFLEDGPIVVRGWILDEGGQPVPRAHVDRLAAREIRGQHGQHDEVLRESQAGVDGVFGLEVPEEELPWVRHRGLLKVLASAPGRDLGAVPVELKALDAADIQLGAATNVRGLVIDSVNRPVAGVAVYVVGIGPVGRESIQGSDDPRPDPLTGWPQPVLTDHDGRFTLAGLDPRKRLSLEVRDDRFGRQLTVVKCQLGPRHDPAGPEDDITINLAPPQYLVGQVLAADTQKPVPFARLSMIPCDEMDEYSRVRRHVDALADADGRFRMQPLPGESFKVYARGQDNDPYLTLVQDVAWPAGTERKEITLALPRGIPVQGQLVKGETGLPVYGAEVQYGGIWTANAKPKIIQENQSVVAIESRTYTGKDGRFTIPALGGSGDLGVSFNREEYQLRLPAEAGSGAFVPVLDKIPLDLPPDSPGKQLRLVLQPWGQLKGQVVDRVSKPVTSGLLISAGQFAYNPYRGGRQ